LRFCQAPSVLYGSYFFFVYYIIFVDFFLENTGRNKVLFLDHQFLILTSKIYIMKIGLIGFGKAGKAVANVILFNKDFSLEWVLRSSTAMEKSSAKEFLGVDTDDEGLIYST